MFWIDYFTGSFFLFYTFLEIGLEYIWVTCDNISALSGEYDTRIICEETNRFQLHVFYLLVDSIYCFA